MLLLGREYSVQVKAWDSESKFGFVVSHVSHGVVVSHVSHVSFPLLVGVSEQENRDPITNKLPNNMTNTFAFIYDRNNLFIMSIVTQLCGSRSGSRRDGVYF